MSRPGLSVALVTYNEEKILPRTLEAVRGMATEIVVVDSHSTDRTRDIAASYGAKVYVEEWKGHVAQKNSALEKCSCEWILFLDADEEVSPELRRSIEEAISTPAYEGYMLNRRTYYLGALLRYTWQPEWRLRLVRRSADPRWEGEDPHDVLRVRGKVGRLKGDLYHYSFTSLEDHILKSLKYAKIAAEGKFRRGERAGVSDLLIRPLWTFLKLFLIKRGVGDGVRGFTASSVSAFYTFMKYAFLMEMELREKLREGLWRK